MTQSNDECPKNISVSSDDNRVDPLPECPYNCPYDPMNPNRPDYVEDTIEENIRAQKPDVRSVEPVRNEEENHMTSITRETGSEAEVHITNVWESKWGVKVGVRSKKEYSYVFSDELNWNFSHHKWNTPRVEDTDLWEIDLDALWYVVSVFVSEDIDVTVDDEVRERYVKSKSDY